MQSKALVDLILGLSLFVVLFVLSLTLHWALMNETSMRSNVVLPQERYFIDAYYYMRLGGEVAATTNGEFFREVSRQAPTPSSYGVVLISSVIAILRIDDLIVPMFWAPIYLAVLLFVYRAYRPASLSVMVLALFPLLPYIFVTSKETVMILGLLVFLLAVAPRYSGTVRTGYSLLSVVLIASSRPEALLLLILSVGLVKLNFKGWFIVCGLFTLGLELRGVQAFINPITYGFQNQAFLAGTANCEFLFFDVCVSEKGSNTWAFCQRLILQLAFPLKWIIDLIEINGMNNVSLQVLLMRSANSIAAIYVIVFVVFYAARRLWLNNFGSVFLGYFSITYLASYAALYFFQGGRPALVVVSLLTLMRGIALKNDKNTKFKIEK